MRDRGRLTAPGDLLNGAALAPEDDTLSGSAEGSSSLAELAAEYGLRPSSAQPSLTSYLAMVWERRHFIHGGGLLERGQPCLRHGQLQPGLTQRPGQPVPLRGQARITGDRRIRRSRRVDLGDHANLCRFR
jgi:hypothetical protein